MLVHKMPWKVWKKRSNFFPEKVWKTSVRYLVQTLYEWMSSTRAVIINYFCTRPSQAQLTKVWLCRILLQFHFIPINSSNKHMLVCDNGCTEDVMRMLKLSLTEFSLPKFYQLFGISKVKSAAVSAFRSSYRPGDRSFAYTPPEQERVSLQSLEVITDALLEIMEVFHSLA